MTWDHSRKLHLSFTEFMPKEGAMIDSFPTPLGGMENPFELPIRSAAPAALDQATSMDWLPTAGTFAKAADYVIWPDRRIAVEGGQKVDWNTTIYEENGFFKNRFKDLPPNERSVYTTLFRSKQITEPVTQDIFLVRYGRSDMMLVPDSSKTYAGILVFRRSGFSDMFLDYIPLKTSTGWSSTVVQQGNEVLVRIGAGVHSLETPSAMFWANATLPEGYIISGPFGISMNKSVMDWGMVAMKSPYIPSEAGSKQYDDQLGAMVVPSYIYAAKWFTDVKAVDESAFDTGAYA